MRLLTIEIKVSFMEYVMILVHEPVAISFKSHCSYGESSNTDDEWGVLCVLILVSIILLVVVTI